MDLIWGSSEITNDREVFKDLVNSDFENFFEYLRIDLFGKVILVAGSLKSRIIGLWSFFTLYDYDIRWQRDGILINRK